MLLDANVSVSSLKPRYPDDDQDSSAWIEPHTAAVLGASAVLYHAHRHALKTSENYRRGLHRFAINLEERSPNRMFRTFRLGEALSSYLPDKIQYSSRQLVMGDYLTPLGETLNRMSFGKLDRASMSDGLRFIQSKADVGTGYLSVEGAEHLRFRFTSGGYMGGTAQRYGSELGPVYRRQRPAESWWSFHRRKQNPNRAFIRGYKEGDTTSFFPTFSKIGAEEEGAGNLLLRGRSAFHNAGTVAFEMGERFQHLMSQVGLGLRAGTYNKFAHVPFVGEGGLVNKMLTRRVLPAYLGYLGIQFLDYKLGHHPSMFIAGLPLKARVFHAEVTDKVPGLRNATDLSANVVPGGQLGPLALPIGGAFLGGVLFHYSKVLRGISREELPTLGKMEIGQKLPKILHDLPKPAAIGAAIGAALMLPFIPGMIGDRKTAAERRRIYSGEELVPVRQGRWWEMGPTPFEGGRIKYFRKHWYAAMKAHAEDVSLYGSESEKWAHNPILHPIKYLRDPYWLEKRNYYDRPYPITSPAFSNVPLVGPLLAATIGKFIKPVKRMHEDEWNPGDDYSLYGQRLDPRGQRVESKLEFLVRQHLSKQGYSVQTQTPILNYRADFTLQGRDGHGIVIEADGERFHRPWRKNKDDNRQRDIERQGYTVLRIRGGDFFSDPDRAMKKIYSRLEKMGVPQYDVQGRDVRSGLAGLAAPVPTEEYSSFKNVVKKETHLLADLVGLPGFIAKSLHEKFFPDKNLGKQVFLEGSRNMTDASRRYYERELGAMAGINPSGDEVEPYGYSEILRRFIQPERELKKANPLRNRMPSWIPGGEYYQDLHKGDPYTQIAEGYARLPGAGYAALHPEVKGLNPEEYPIFNRFEILADVAPYSRQFKKYRDIVRKAGTNDTTTRIAFERVMDRLAKIKESSIPIKERRFSAKTETISGTVEDANEYGVSLKELPGRRFSFSSLGTSTADLAALVAGQQNTETAAAKDVDHKRQELQSFLSKRLAPGTSVKLTVSEGVREHATNARAVFEADGKNINRDLIKAGLAVERPDRGGAESSALYGAPARLLGSYGEHLAFTGDENPFNLARYIPQPYNTKLWQNRTAISQYEQREVYGTSMRRWHRPVHDFLEPYARGAVRRFTGKRILPEEVQFHRDVNTLADTLKYLRGVVDGYTNESRRSSIGANLFSPSEVLTGTLSDHEAAYFRSFLQETDDKKRRRIIEDVSPELSRALTAQWAAKDAEVARADGKKVGPLGENGRLFSRAGLEDYRKARTQLDYADYERSKEIAEFFHRTGFSLPGEDSATLNEGVDYQDIKAKVIQQEGYELHDFNIFDDRASQLWRKPYLDGMVRELTSGDRRSVETLRQAVETMMVNGRNRSPKVRAVKHAVSTRSTNVKVTVDVDQQKEILKDARRNPEKYQDDAA